MSYRIPFGHQHLSGSSRRLYMHARDDGRLIKQAVTWAGTNGLVYTDGDILCTHAPVALLPNSFPRDSFEYLKSIQPIFNVLIDSVARDKDFILATLLQTAETDDFMKRLLNIFLTLPASMIKNSINLGIHRSDYMIQQVESDQGITHKALQIEINTIASSFGCLSKKVVDLHRYMLMRNAESKDLEDLLLDLDAEFSSDSATASTRIPDNPSTRIIAFGIAMAHFLYGDSKAIVLFVVQPGEKNYGDQRLLEAELWGVHGKFNLMF